MHVTQHLNDPLAAAHADHPDTEWIVCLARPLYDQLLAERRHTSITTWQGQHVTVSTGTAYPDLLVLTTAVPSWLFRQHLPGPPGRYGRGDGYVREHYIGPAHVTAIQQDVYHRLRTDETTTGTAAGLAAPIS